MSAEAPYFGIDFGTTNSSMAWYDPEKREAKILDNFEGERETPSVVYFGEDEVLVGKEAEDKLRQYENSPDPQERKEAAGRTEKSIKRRLINPPFFSIPGRDEPVRPVDVVAEILKKLKRDAENEHFYEEIERVVITHPAVFGMKEREVLLEAAGDAKFRRVDLFDEPTAAALTVTRLGQKVGDGVMVYDLGAGTFDLSVLVRDEEGAFYLPMEPRGKPKCGGDDFDLALYEHCDGIARETLNRPISLTGDQDLVFLRECRERKHNLTSSKRCTFSSMLASENGIERFKHKVEQEEFWALIRPQVQETVEMTAGLWEDAGEQGHELDTLVLIGGGSRVLLIKDLLKEKLGIEPRNFAGKDYAVALGAAYRAYEIWKPPNGKIDPGVAEYRRVLKICWTDRKLTPAEVQWLKNLVEEELKLDPQAAADVEREVMGRTLEEVLALQEKTAAEHYREVLKLGWKEKKLEVLKRIPSSRLDMLLDNHELFCEYDFPDSDSPVSTAKRKELLGRMPWTTFMMAARVATDESLNAHAAAERLRTLANELGLSKEQAVEVERNVLNSTVEEHLVREEQKAKQVILDEYRNAVEKASGARGLNAAKEKLLKEQAERLRLDRREADRIEREVLNDTVAAILAEQKEVQKLARQHEITLSQVKGTGKDGRVTRQDIERHIESLKRGEVNTEAQQLLDQAREQFNPEQPDLALQTAQAACELAPDYAPAFSMKAWLLYLKGEYRLAVAAATSCLRIEPENLEALRVRSLSKWAMEDYSGVKQDEDRLVALAPGFGAHLSRAQTNFRLGDNKAAMSDIQSALRDPEAPEDQLGAAQAALGFILHNRLNSPKDALSSFESALKAIPEDHDEEYSQKFSGAFEAFGIEVQDPPVTTVHKWLREACKALYGNSREAAQDFMVHTFGDSHPSVDYSVWRGDPEFGLYYASELAKKGEGSAAASWLRGLFNVHSDFDIRRVKADRWIKQCKDTTLREFLTPKFSHSSSIGSFFNSLTVTNESAFRTTSIEVTVRIVRNDGQHVAPIKGKFEALGPGESSTWTDIFPDAGLFGGNIKQSTVHVKCAED